LAKSTHVIEKYSVSEDTILCVCSWLGITADFKQHQKDAKPTKKQVSDRFKFELQPRFMNLR